MSNPCPSCDSGSALALGVTCSACGRFNSKFVIIPHQTGAFRTGLWFAVASLVVLGGVAGALLWTETGGVLGKEEAVVVDRSRTETEGSLLERFESRHRALAASVPSTSAVRAARQANERGLASSRLRRWKLAGAEFSEAAGLDPTSAEYRDNLAFVHLRLGEVVEARQAVEAALERAPRRAATWRNYAEVLARSDDRPGAVVAIQNALELSPRREAVQAGFRATARASSTDPRLVVAIRSALGPNL